jgi:hypothetical protein
MWMRHNLNRSDPMSDFADVYVGCGDPRDFSRSDVGKDASARLSNWMLMLRWNVFF